MFRTRLVPAIAMVLLASACGDGIPTPWLISAASGASPSDAGLGDGGLGEA